MMRPLGFLIAGLLAIVCMGATAQAEIKQEHTAETMKALCEGTQPNEAPDLQSMVCTFRIQGVAEMMQVNCLSAQQGWKPAPALAANPIGSNKALRQTFINYMKSHPERWQDHWVFVLAEAISEKFPCEDR